MNFRISDNQTTETLEDVISRSNSTDIHLEETALTLHQLFERQVEKSPDRCAVKFRDESLTYGELNNRANQMAHYLREVGVTRNMVVPIIADRSFEMIVAIYAILKAGGAYLPISPADPSSRVMAVLEDTRTDLVLVQSSYSDNYTSFGGRLILVDTIDWSLPKHNLPPVNGSSDLCYVIYTSGSTGKPKGVMIRHDAIINRLKWMQSAFPITSKDTILQKTPFNFDVSVWEIFWWALEGAQMALLPPQEERNPVAIIGAVHKHQVTVMHFVPSMLNVFLEFLKDGVIQNLGTLRLVFSSGESLTPAHVKKFGEKLHQPHGTRLVNLYGPTEATVDVTYWEVDDFTTLSKVCIGKPIFNTRAYIVHEDDHATLYNDQPGELCIAGMGLASGYLHNPVLTDTYFVDCPFWEGHKMYKTGDIARWNERGEIEFLGRKDHQIKIRGLRVELEEVEACLREYPGIVSGVISSLTLSETVMMLVAYYVSAGEIDSQTLKVHLKRALPAYMIPAHFMRLSELPFTGSGKIDRKKLPNPFFREGTRIQNS